MLPGHTCLEELAVCVCWARAQPGPSTPAAQRASRGQPKGNKMRPRDPPRQPASSAADLQGLRCERGTKGGMPWLQEDRLLSTSFCNIP